MISRELFTLRSSSKLPALPHMNIGQMFRLNVAYFFSTTYYALAITGSHLIRPNLYFKISITTYIPIFATRQGHGQLKRFRQFEIRLLFMIDRLTPCTNTSVSLSDKRHVENIFSSIKKRQKSQSVLNLVYKSIIS